MENKINKLISVAYKLYSVENEKETMVEEATEERPFEFISGFGFTLESFEAQIIPLSKGDTFDFTLSSEEAYGEHLEERVLELDKEMFKTNGHFDHEHIYKDAIVPLVNEDGNHFTGHVLDITDNIVRMDINHPLAGKSLKFVGHIIDSREATNKEIEKYINMVCGEHHCHCGEDSCGGEEGGCCCGHGHEDHDGCECQHGGHGHENHDGCECQHGGHGHGKGHCHHDND